MRDSDLFDSWKKREGRGSKVLKNIDNNTENPNGKIDVRKAKNSRKRRQLSNWIENDKFSIHRVESVSNLVQAKLLTIH